MSDQASPALRSVDPAAIREAGPAGFAQAVTATCQPTLLPGLCRHWPAVEASGRGWGSLSTSLGGFDAGR
jgi:hypothetical protein